MLETDVQAGPALDAEIARRAFEIDVLGIAPCTFEPECGSLEVGLVYAQLADGSDVEQRPVFLQRCCCDVAPEIKTELYFGHERFCLDAVDRYSTDIAAAMLIPSKVPNLIHFALDWQIGQGWKAAFTVLRSGPAAFATADKPAEAICRAALKAIDS